MAGPGHEETTPMEEGAEVKPHQRLLRSKGFIPTVVVVALGAFVLLSPRMAGSPPRLEIITPTRGEPGSVMVLTGRNFGSQRDTSEVRIAGIAPTSLDYREWTDTRISVSIPEEATSGIVYVITRSGRSGGLLYIDQREIPQVASGANHPGEPYIVNSSDNPIQPSAARVGDTITIYGLNFGLERGTSEVKFAWAGQQAEGSDSLDTGNMLPARDYNLDYVSWSDREIRVRAPDGAASGNVVVITDKGQSNARYFVVNKGAGIKAYSSPRKYSVQYGLDVTATAASGDNSLYLWLPLILPAPEQGIPKRVGQDPAPVLDTSQATLVSFTNLQKGGKYRSSMSWIFDRYAISTQVSLGDVPAYDAGSELYQAFTKADRLVLSTSQDVQKAAAAAVGGERNPWLKARRIYDWLLTQLSPGITPGDAAASLRAKRGDTLNYAALYCALLRAAGIPSRMVAGYYVRDAAGPAVPHFWDEFYVESLGWVPVDPLLGDDGSRLSASTGSDFDNRSYYFGNLDNQHITLTKGLAAVKQMNPAGVTKLHADLPFLLTFHEEAVGPLTGYSAVFENLAVTGTY